MKKKILVYTASRSEYGILKSIIFELKKTKNINLRVLATGTHLRTKFGKTIKEIESDNVNSLTKINTFRDLSDEKNISSAISNGISKISEYLRIFKPDIVLILGDRFDLFGVGIASLINNIPLAHIHGGESTYGLIDDYVRHSITKISTFHFTSNKVYRKRIIQMGENPKNVICTGSPSVDLIKNLKFLNKEELKKKLNIIFKKKILTVTYNPISTNKKKTIFEINNLLNALRKYKNSTIIYTLPTFDNYSYIISKKIKQACENNENMFCFNSLGHTNYLSLIKLSDIVIGNSSSGIIEAPYLKIPTLNIGDRQLGREMSPSIFNVKPNTNDIKNKIDYILSIKNKKNLYNKNIYGDGQASKKISKFLVKINLKTIQPGKKFFDINF
ncbi:UDP-N-acetylglucosamine 2-epimerase [bacterium]|nr:UDP-N-acetylglucosamine 2-epimerase [bacterium]